MRTKNSHDCCLKEDATNYKATTAEPVWCRHAASHEATAQICERWLQVFWPATCVCCTFQLRCLNCRTPLDICPFIKLLLLGWCQHLHVCTSYLTLISTSCYELSTSELLRTPRLMDFTRQVKTNTACDVSILSWFEGLSVLGGKSFSSSCLYFYTKQHRFWAQLLETVQMKKTSGYGVDDFSSRWRTEVWTSTWLSLRVKRSEVWIQPADEHLCLHGNSLLFYLLMCLSPSQALRIIYFLDSSTRHFLVSNRILPGLVLYVFPWKWTLIRNHRAIKKPALTVWGLSPAEVKQKTVRFCYGMRC